MRLFDGPELVEALFAMVAGVVVVVVVVVVVTVAVVVVVVSVVATTAAAVLEVTPEKNLGTTEAELDIAWLMSTVCLFVFWDPLLLLSLSSEPSLLCFCASPDMRVTNDATLRDRPSFL